MKSIREIIKEEIKILKEEFSGGKLYGYHCTPCKNVQSIERTGFKIGPRDMQGIGVYAFYNLRDNSSGNAAVGYGQRHVSEEEFCIVKFEIEHPNWLMILIKDIAEDVLGNDADILKQIDNQYTEGWNGYVKEWFRYISPEYRTKEFAEQHKIWLQEKFNMNNEIGSQYLMFGNGLFESLARFGIIYYGEYGIQYLIKNPKIMQPLGYYHVKRVNWELTVSDFIPFTSKSDEIKNIILSDEKYNDLAEYINRINSIEDLQTLKAKFRDKQMEVRNNRDFDYYQNMIDQIDDLIR